MSTPLRRRLKDSLVVAMKARDRVALAALRSTLAAIDNAEAVDAPPVPGGSLAIERTPVGVGAAELARRELTEADVERIVRAEIDQREEAARGYDRVGRPDAAARLRDEVRVLAAYLAG